MSKYLRDRMRISLSLLLPYPQMFLFGCLNLGKIFDLLRLYLRYIVHLMETSPVIPVLHLKSIHVTMRLA